MPMRRGDRRNSNDDNALNNPRARQQEPATREALEKSNATLRDQKRRFKQERDAAKQTLEEQKAQLKTQQAEFLVLRENYNLGQALIQERDAKIASLEAAVQTYKAKASQQAAISSNENFEQLFAEMRDRFYAEQKASESNLALYNQERSRADHLEAQYSHADSERERFVTLYEGIQDTLQLERETRIEEQQAAKSNLALYQQERSRADNLQSQFSHAEAERERFLSLYSDVQKELKSERNSKVNLEEWESRVNELQTQSERATQRLQVAQSDLETAQSSLNTLQLQYDETLGLYQQQQEAAQQHIDLYEQEQARAQRLQAQYAQAESERERFTTLYAEVQEELKSERRSKAGIKGWETRRKRENAKLKQEISEMANILKGAMADKDSAISELYEVANRMDRIQQLVDSVEGETTSGPVGLLQKFKLVWQAIQDIFSE